MSSVKRKRDHNNGTAEASRQIFLRELDAASDHFSQLMRNEPMVKVYDRSVDAVPRELPSNEISAMALNELAQSGGRGFFYYLPSRHTLRSNKAEHLLPEGRVIASPGAMYPTLLYMDFVWDAAARAAFKKESHRGRYLRCNAIMNPPTEHTPLYAIQHSASALTPLYCAASSSLVLLECSPTFVLLSAGELETIIGRWSSNWKATGPDPELRLSTLPYLFDDSKVHDGNRHYLQALQSYRHASIAEVYHEILRRCRIHFGDLASTMNPSTLRSVIARGTGPFGGEALGTPVQLEGGKDVLGTALHAAAVTSSLAEAVGEPSEDIAFFPEG